MTQTNQQPRQGEARFCRIFARDSDATELLHGCPVVTAEGTEIGKVEALLVDRKTLQLRYVMLTCGQDHAAPGAAVAIPWQSLYFDSSLARLVFYTYS